MKTTSYNAEKEIRIGILVAVFAISIFTAVRVKELQLNEATNAELTRSSQILMNKENIPSMPTLDARLIEEPVQATVFLKANKYKASEYVKSEMALERERFLNSNSDVADAELALQIKSWMSAAEYKATDYANADMALESERFLNGENESIEAELALQVKSWMTATEYKATDFANADMAYESEKILGYENEAIEAELALQIKSWMTAAAYKATDFVNAEMALESEKFLNGNAPTNNEVASAETAENGSTLAIE